jgi:threonine dehydrogenase-like Zn-dependent dehydrogenase
MVVTAAYMKPVEMPLGAMLTSEMTITTAMGYPTEMPEVVSALPRLQEKLTPMISHHFPLDQVLAALDAARDPASAKVMIDIGQH